MNRYNVGINYELDAQSPEDAQRQFVEVLYRLMSEEICIEECVEVCRVD